METARVRLNIVGQERLEPLHTTTTTIVIITTISWGTCLPTPLPTSQMLS